MSPAKRTEYNREYKRKWRAKRRAMGLGYIDREGMSLESYARSIELHKLVNRTPRGRQLNKIRAQRYYAKSKELYGGRIDRDIHARVKWLEAKANERTNERTTRTTTSA